MPTGSRLRPSVLAARERLSEGREQLRRQHDLGMDGVKVCGRLTTLVDGAVTQLFDAYLAEVSDGEADEIRRRVSLVAHGGYGRRQQAPFSDVDLMLLYEGRADEMVRKLASRLTQDICDVCSHLGHSLRTPAEAVRRARSDAQIGSSLVESRLLLGNSDVYSRFHNAMQAMVRRRGVALARAFVAERRTERLQYGETVYLLEPNVKRSRGGLRDLHLLRWLWFIKAGVADPDRLHNMGVLSKFDYRRLMSAQSFLLRVRNEMHFHAGDTHDALNRAEQLRLAEVLQYRGREGVRPVEQLMRDYFHHTHHVWQLVHRLSEMMQPPSRVSWVLQPVLTRTTEDGFQIGRDEVSATSRAMAQLAHHREHVLRLVDLARHDGKRIGQDTWHFIYRTAPQYTSEPRPEVNRLFLNILAEPLRLGELLRRLHEMGVLEKIVPPFAHARSLLQFNQYHKYTVDEHCIRAVEEATNFRERTDTLGEVYRRLKDKTTLHLALLLHDLGKGYQTDHSEVGRRIARDMAQRFALAAEPAETLEFLVYRHLLMSHLALKYDTSQPQLIERFVGEVRDQARLDMLLIVTCADLAAVGPGVLNSWKLEVLYELYHRASRRLAAPSGAPVEERRDRERQAAWKLLAPAEQGDPWFAEQLAALPEGYVARRPAEAVAEALRRLRHLPARAGIAWGNYLKETDTVEFIAGIDQGTGRAIFSSMAGALTSNRMQILAAETNTLAHGLLLLRYVAYEPESPGEPTAERLAAVSNALVTAIDSDRAPTFPKILGREQQEAAAALSDLPNEVRIDNELSHECTIVEVFTVDRRGLLYRLARALHDVGSIIRFAKIGTYLDQVVDVFYVAERDGSKPTDNQRLEEIRSALKAVIAPQTES